MTVMSRARSYGRSTRPARGRSRSGGACLVGPGGHHLGVVAGGRELIDLTPDRIKEVCHAALLAGEPGRVDQDDIPHRAVCDSRHAGPGDLFVGILGERADGGRFAEQAVESGAWGVLLTVDHALRIASMAPDRLRVFSVEKPIEALGRLARAWVDRLWTEGAKTIAITGSTGKTSTKDILLALLKPALGGAVYASRENYNTEIGLPLAVLEASPGAKAIVLEMAMRGRGQIDELCDIAPPDIGVITNVGPVHLELLGSLEAVAEAKAELIARLPAEGTCIVPAAAEALRPHLREEVRTLTFAEWPHPHGGPLEDTERIAGAAADLRVIRAESAEIRGHEGLRAEIAVGAVHGVFEFNFPQAHNLVNALAAIGAAHALGIPLEALQEGAGNIELSALRGEEVELRDDALLINDCYNANPLSMRAALDHLADVAARRGSRAVAVLGEMAELGPDTHEYHRGVGDHAGATGVGLLIAVGQAGNEYVEGYGTAGEAVAVADAAEAARTLDERLTPKDVVLVKGSRRVGLEAIAQSMVEQPVGGVP